MQHWKRWLGVVVGLTACGDDGQGTDPPVVGSATDGDDPTEGDGPALGCLIEPEAGSAALRYQCEGDIVIDVTVESPFDESPVMDSLLLTFGHGVEGDSYDEPHVMACCPKYDLHAPDCEQGHERACMADLAEQGCKSIETNLRDFADDHYGGPGLENSIVRSAVNKIADYVQTHQGDCIEQFVTNTGIGSTAPSCDPDGSGVDYDTLLATGEWSFDPDGVVDLVTISVAMASWTGVYPTHDRHERCTSADENDGVLFLELDPAPWAKRLLLANGTAVLHGPGLEVVGVAELEALDTGCTQDRCSRIAIAVDRDEGTASLDDLQFQLAGTAEVGYGSISMPVDRFGVRLWDGTRAILDGVGTTATIPPGGAWFVVNAASGESRGVVSATNETAIVLHREGGGWSSSAFMIAHRDAAGERWALAIMPARWQ